MKMPSLTFLSPLTEWITISSILLIQLHTLPITAYEIMMIKLMTIPIHSMRLIFFVVFYYNLFFVHLIPKHKLLSISQNVKSMKIKLTRWLDLHIFVQHILHISRRSASEKLFRYRTNQIFLLSECWQHVDIKSFL